MSEYGIEFADWCEFPPETMVGETVYDGEGNAIGWITNATVGRETLTAEQVRECAMGVYFEGYSDGATHREHGIEDTDWQTIADKLNATLGSGTCRIKERHGDWYCTGCGEMVGACDTASELCIDGNAIELWRHCPLCGRRIEVDE